MALTFSLLVAMALSASRAPADAKYDPPEGIVPTTATLSQILKDHDAAVGRLAPSVADTRTDVWKFNKSGLAGIETLIRRGYDYHSRIVSGPIVEEYGQFSGARWYRDPNGYVTPILGKESASFEMLRVLFDASDPKNDVKLLGEVATPSPAYVVEVKRPNFHHPEWVFFDKKTALIDEIVQIIDDERITSIYSDYRKTKGLTEPWHVHDTNGQTALDDDFSRSSLTIGQDINPMEFITPQSSSTLDFYSGHVSIPGKVVFADDAGMVYSHGDLHTVKIPSVIVRVVVNGRGLDFELSSGGDSLIDQDIAEELGLPSYGQVKRTPKGEYVPYVTVIPQAQVGALTLRNYAVTALPFHYHVNGETKVVGTLGYDVLAGGVFKVDYMKSTIDLDPIATFDSPMPVQGTYVLPVHFIGGWPFFSGTIDSHVTNNMLFDSSFDMSFVFGTFTRHYPDAVSDAISGEKHGTASIPFADDTGYGKEFEIWLAKVPNIRFGLTNFADWQLIATNGDAAYGGQDVDAVMGADLAQYYDTYLDFAHGRIFLKPNSSFYDTFKIKSP